MAELAKGGTSRSAWTSSARMRPWACVIGTSSASSGATRSRIRSRACATVSTSRFSDLPIVPVAVFELGGSALTIGDHVLVEAGGDHLVRHRARNSEFGETLDLVGHDLVTGSLDGSDHVIDRRARLWPTGTVFGSCLYWDLGLRFLGRFRFSVFGLFSHGMFHLTTGNRVQADTVRLAGPRLACTRSIANRNVSLATAVTGAARNMPISPKSDAPRRVLKIKSRGCTFVKRPEGETTARATGAARRAACRRSAGVRRSAREA